MDWRNNVAHINKLCEILTKNAKMKVLNIILITLFFLVLSCKNKTENNEVTEIGQPDFVQKYGKLFFDYDEIEYYHIDYDEKENQILIPKNLKSKIKKLNLNLELGDIQNDIKDVDFINKLENIGFIKKEIDKSNFNEINEIFIEKKVKNPKYMKCLPIFRDILVFKKKGKIIGISKICFSCLQNQIIGTKSITENFGQDGDYEKLKDILYD